MPQAMQALSLAVQQALPHGSSHSHLLRCQGNAVQCSKHWHAALPTALLLGFSHLGAAGSCP